MSSKKKIELLSSGALPGSFQSHILSRFMSKPELNKLLELYKNNSFHRVLTEPSAQQYEVAASVKKIGYAATAAKFKITDNQAHSWTTKVALFQFRSK
jgi:hypothetical protein